MITAKGMDMNIEKELSDMTLTELWELFPIILQNYNSDYKVWYQLESDQLMNEFQGGILLRITHIGSTAVEGLISKPTVDILMEISKDSNLIEIKARLEAKQWSLMNETNSPIFKQTYSKGYTKYGFAEKVYHLHVRYLDDWDELYFRDYLIEHSKIANQYGQLKLGLLNDYKHNRDGYTDAKSEFIKRISLEAKKKYKNRYTP